MKTVVINLESRKDRLEAFKKNNLKYISYERFDAVNGYDIDYKKLTEDEYDTDHNWIDPILKTPITRGEIGCFLSHYKLWQRCIESNEPYLILEDDAIISDKFSYDDLYKLIRGEGYNFIYLGWKEMNESGSTPVIESFEPTIVADVKENPMALLGNMAANLGNMNESEKYVIPVYPYWLLAYVITPEAAKILVNKEIEQNIIPIDEYVPKKLSELNSVAYKENVINPYSRDEMGSNINPSDRYDYFIDFNIHPVTIATDESKAKKILDSGKAHNIEFNNIGAGIEWNGGTMESTGGGQKVNMIKSYIENLPDHDVLFFCDGYDTFVTDSLDEIVYRYLSMNHRIIFSSERSCWPDEGLASEIIKTNKTITPYEDTPYKYLNSGLFIAQVGELKSILEDVSDDSDDQLFYQKKYLEQKYDMALDLECYIFQCSESAIIQSNGQMYNPITRCYNCVYHGNGGDSEKRTFDRLYKQFYTNSPMLYIPTTDYKILSDDMILVDFMTEQKCREMIQLAEDQEFHSHYADNVPSQDLRLKEIGLWNELEKHWNSVIYEIVYKYWNPCHMWGLRDAFLIKYTMDGQKELRLHNDASLVTGSVKLNDDYTGGVLSFPRQGITNEDIPIGKLILFPGQVTHGHTSTELLSGTKYSLTIWSQRYKGDTL